ncbi:MAG: GTP cyclohydrolase I FolE [Anaerolineae bacterium]
MSMQLNGYATDRAARRVRRNPDREQSPRVTVLDGANSRGRDESRAALEAAAREILVHVGEDPDREGLVRTPHRVAKMYEELLEGYDQDLDTVVNGALFDVEYGDGEMVVVAGIPYSSMCEHHMLPFTGQAHVAYIPRDKVIGLSKIPRILDMFSRRLQIQERLGNEVADAMVEALDPLGVMVVIEGQHSCSALRGVKKHGSSMVTTARRGAFRSDPALRTEFYQLVGESRLA